MSKLALLYLTIVVSMLFMLIPDNDKTMSFPLSNQIVSQEYYIYSIFEFGILLILTGIIANEATEYKFALWVFFGLIAVDLLDWIVTYNTEWTFIHGIPISMNTTKCVIFGLVIIRELWNKSTGR